MHNNVSYDRVNILFIQYLFIYVEYATFYMVEPKPTFSKTYNTMDLFNIGTMYI